MTNLSQLLEEPHRNALVDDLADFATNLINEQSGISGVAIKGAFSAAKAADKRVVPKAINRLLPDVLGDLDPHWQEFTAAEEPDFGTFLEPHTDDVVDAIMSVADRKAEEVSMTAIRKAYQSVRGKGSKIIAPTVPDLARILQRHMDNL